MNHPHQPTSAIDIGAALKRYFGFDNFRGHQMSIIQHVLSGESAIVIMPTGGGKSLCYQLPAIVSPGMALVISPLIALMRDQVLALRANGMAAAAINSSMSSSEVRTVFADVEAGQVKLLYLSPERAMTAQMLDWLQERQISLIAIDEVHCVSIWGNDFRPEYAALSGLLQRLPQVPVLALTATADKATQTDIQHQLELRDARLFVSSFERKNIFIGAAGGQDRFARVLRFIEHHRGEAGIIYALSRRSTEELAAKLRQHGYAAEHYHAEVAAAQKRKVQDAFQQDQLQIVCATIAFGMGIDKANIRWIIHYNMPKNIESYYQEIGRAGRDGEPAETLMFASFRDVTVYRSFIEQSEADDDFKEVQRQKLERIWELAQATSCRTNVILNYFGEYRNTGCGHCDNCKQPPEGFDGTVLAQKALSAVKRTRESVGVQILTDILRGSMRQEIREKGFDRIKTFGAGRDESRRAWLEYITQMINQGVLDIDYTRGSRLVCTPIGETVLRNEGRVTLYKTSFTPGWKPRPTSRKALFEEGLVEQLKTLRKDLALELGVPAFAIFSDRTLGEIAAAKPLTTQQFLQIHGVGTFKAEQYGARFMDAVRTYIRQQKHLKQPRGKTYLETLDLLRAGKSISEIAAIRGLHPNTIVAHLVHLYELGEDIDLRQYFAPGQVEIIRKAWLEAGQPEALRPVMERLPEETDFNQIKMALAIFGKE